ncbi:hypothetical protein EAE96_008499 [Botrytis aclada]|nr:hypothetical protein EAE96_008499 [Botrytis aclada]
MDIAAEQSNGQPSEERKDSGVDTDDIKTEEFTSLDVELSPDGSVTIPREIGTYHTRSVILVHDVFDDAAGWTREFVDARHNGETLMSIFPGTNWCFPQIDYPWLVRDLESETSDPTDEMIDSWSAYTETDDLEERVQIAFELGKMLHPIQQLIERESNLLGIRNVFIGGISDGATAALQLFLASQANQGGGLGGFIGMNAVLPFHSVVKVLVDPTANLEDLSLEEYIDRQMESLENVVSLMRINLDLPPAGTFDRSFTYLGTPIFLGSIMTNPADVELKDKRDDMIDILRRLRCFHPIYYTDDFKEPNLDGQVEGLVEYLQMTGSIRVPG